MCEQISKFYIATNIYTVISCVYQINLYTRLHSVMLGNRMLLAYVVSQDIENELLLCALVVDFVYDVFQASCTCLA